MNSKLETPQLETRNSQLIIAWEITRRCALACKHCRGAARDCDYAGEFNTEECFKTIDALADFSKPMIILTGGEPLMRGDVFKVARYATDKGCRVVLATCGHLLTAEVALQLKEAGVMAVSVSLDAATAAKHDAFRGISGAYTKTVAALDHLKAAVIPFQINTTVSKRNVDELPELLAQAIKLGAATIDFFFLVPTGRGSEIANFALDPEERDRALEWIAAQAKTAPIRVKTTCVPQYKKFLSQESGIRGQESEDPRRQRLARNDGSDQREWWQTRNSFPHPELETRNPELETRNPELETRNPELETRNPELATRNSDPATRNSLNSKLETSPTGNSPFKGCMGGRGFVFISHTGILQPCGFLDLPCGDLRAAGFDFETLYHDSEVFNNMRTLNPFAACPARVYARCGDYMGKES